jgi:hypothetical protein
LEWESGVAQRNSVRPEPVEGLRQANSACDESRVASEQASDRTMSFWVYILRCANNSYYTGHTDNLEGRIAKHKTGEIEGYTSTRLSGKVGVLRTIPDSGRSFNL